MGKKYQKPKEATKRPMRFTFAPQGMKLVTTTVMRRSFSFSMVRVAMIPGTEQPVPIRIGIKLLPERPNYLKILSKIKAIRDM